jgi:hypothetical protein
MAWSNGLSPAERFADIASSIVGENPNDHARRTSSLGSGTKGDIKQSSQWHVKLMAIELLIELNFRDNYPLALLRCLIP